MLSSTLEVPNDGNRSITSYYILDIEVKSPTTGSSVTCGKRLRKLMLLPRHVTVWRGSSAVLGGVCLGTDKIRLTTFKPWDWLVKPLTSFLERCTATSLLLMVSSSKEETRKGPLLLYITNHDRTSVVR